MLKRFSALRSRPKRLTAIAPLAIAAFSAMTAAAVGGVAPDDPPIADPTFGAVVDIQLVNVDVWVTDAKGLPVTGLEGADFEVLEDGEPVVVTYFNEVRAALPGPEPRPSRPEAGPTENDLPAKAETPPAHLIVYFDEAHLPAGGRKRLVADLRDFVAAGDVPMERVLVLRQTGQLTVEASFDSTAEELDAALANLAAPSTLGTQTEQERRLAVSRLQQLWRDAQILASNGDPRGGGLPAPCNYFLPRAVPEVERAAEEAARRVFRTLGDLDSLSGFLSGLRGVKTVLFLSNALETRPGAGLMGFVDDVCPASQQSTSFALVNRDLSESFRRLTRHANANQVTIYALQTGGLQTSFLGAAEQASVDFRGSSRFETILRDNARGGLTYLASETGGRAVFNTNRFARELGRIGREITEYYSLAYEPPHGGDGGEHRIEVRMKEPGLRVRHRQGYRDKRTEERTAERLEGALYLGLADNPLEARLGAGAVREIDDELYALPLHVMVPVERLTFLGRSEEPNRKSVARLEVLVTARNVRNSRVVSTERLFRVEEPSGGGGGLADLVVPLELRRSRYMIAVAARDVATGETAYISTTVDLAPESAALE